MTDTEFVDIIGFEGTYQINRLGVVMSKGGLIKKPYIKPAGYAEHKLWGKDKKFHNKLLHRLLGEAFIPNPENKPTIDHIDRNTSNNAISNLRWATHLEQHANMTTSLHFETADEKRIYVNKRQNDWRIRNKIYLAGAKELREIEI